MIDEGYIEISCRGRGAGAFLRRKQWWSFEGLDTERGVYFVFLAMQAFPTGFVSLTVLDTRSGERAVEEFMCGLSAAPGDAVDVQAKPGGGSLRFCGRAEDGWRIEARAGAISAEIAQKTVSGMHRNRLETKRIDYTILQSVRNDAEGRVICGGREYEFSGYGYFEHAWGVQPRLSVANWMHFWSPEASGVVLDCSYDRGVPHCYTYLWSDDGEHYLHAPARFGFDPLHPAAEWRVESPDLCLAVRPVHVHHTVKKIPPVLPYIDINYHELLAEVRGEAMVRGAAVSIEGMGKYDFNVNRW